VSSLEHQQRRRHQGAAVRDAEGPSEQATINPQALCSCRPVNEMQTAYSDAAADTATSLDLLMGQLLTALRSQTYELLSYLASGDALVEVAIMAHVKQQVNSCCCICSPHALCPSSASLGRGMCLGQDPQ